MVWPFRSAQQRLDDEAARWLTRMRGPDRHAYRDRFEAWCLADPAHREAIEEAMAGFEEASVLELADMGIARGLPTAPPRAARRTVPMRYAFGAVVAAAAVALIFLVSAYLPPQHEQLGSSARYAAAGPREIRLPDGSLLRLGAESIAVVDYEEDQRRITLERGSGRFQVAHEERPFRVSAGDAEVLARGTVFDVALSGRATRVSLIEGSVDVSYRAAAEEPMGTRVARLQPGQQIVVDPRGSRASAQETSRRPSTQGMLEFDDTPLAQAVAVANRGSRTRIALGDASVGRLRVTGAFRAGDTRGLARSLEAAFGLRLQELPDGTLLLRSSSAP